MKNVSVINLAILQLKREGKDPEKNIDLIIERAFSIVKYLDIQERNKKVSINRYKNLLRV